MSEAKHTPGPWRVGDTEEKQNYLQKPIWADDSMAVVCYVVGTTNPMLDWFAGAANYHMNAHLIAAAPELLESLSVALESLEGVWEQEGFYTCDKDLQRMRSAIAKAKGESQ